MQIVDESSPLYTKYITENYDGVAYHDEPKFLKVREVIKLILAVEWLYKEKGVRVDQEWIAMHTCISANASEETHLELRTRKKPPYKMVPRPIVFRRPSSDVTVKTWEAEMYRTLKAEYGLERRYGYYDFGGSEVIMFKEDGTKCPTRKSMKFSFDYTGDVSVKGWLYLPMSEGAQLPETLKKARDELLKELPPNTRQEIAYPIPMLVDTTVGVVNDESELQLKITKSVYPCPPLALPPSKQTMIVTASIDNYDKLFANVDPNVPIQPEIPGVCDAIVPGVDSWEELISELSVPFPRIWQAPFFGIGEPTATGGVATSNIPVREEPMRKRVVAETANWKDNYKRSGLSLAVRAVDITAQGKCALFRESCHSYILIPFHRSD